MTAAAAPVVVLSASADGGQTKKQKQQCGTLPASLPIIPQVDKQDTSSKLCAINAATGLPAVNIASGGVETTDKSHAAADALAVVAPSGSGDSAQTPKQQKRQRTEAGDWPSQQRQKPRKASESSCCVQDACGVYTAFSRGLPEGSETSTLVAVAKGHGYINLDEVPTGTDGIEGYEFETEGELHSC